MNCLSFNRFAFDDSGHRPRVVSRPTAKGLLDDNWSLDWRMLLRFRTRNASSSVKYFPVGEGSWKWSSKWVSAGIITSSPGIMANPVATGGFKRYHAWLWEFVRVPLLESWTLSRRRGGPTPNVRVVEFILILFLMYPYVSMYSNCMYIFYIYILYNYMYTNFLSSDFYISFIIIIIIIIIWTWAWVYCIFTNLFYLINW